MADGELSIGRRVTAAGYEDGARQAEVEEESFRWLVAVAKAVQDPRLDNSTRRKIYALIIEARDGEAVCVERPEEVRVEQNLGRAAELATAGAESAHRQIADGYYMRDLALENSWPPAAPPPPGPPPADLAHPEGGGLGFLTR